MIEFFTSIKEKHIMKRLIIRLIVALLTFVIGVGTVALLKSSVPHPSDFILIKNLYDHEADFSTLVKMANEDSKARTIDTSFVGFGGPSWIYLYEDKPWPRSESELGFTKRRWDEYRCLFKKLKLDYGMNRKHDMPGAIFFTASFDFSVISEGEETAVMKKGYVYNPNGIYDSLTGSLDGIEINRPAIFYKKLNDRWYLYYEWSVSKPE
jgi:hypothetical protein